MDFDLREKGHRQRITHIKRQCDALTYATNERVLNIIINS